MNAVFPLRRVNRLVVAAACIVASIVEISAQASPDFSADRFRAHVAFLADDLLEGREAGTRGYEIAARYVASQFAVLGVKPASPDGTYFEPVPLAEWSRSGLPATMTLTSPGGTRVLKDRVDAIIRGPVEGGTARVRGSLVFVGYGVVDAALGIDDYKDLDVSGKIAVALAAPMTGIDSEVAAHLMHEQRRVAAEHGAVGLIGIQTRTMSKVFPWQTVIAKSSGPDTTWVREDGTPEDPSHGMKAVASIAPAAAPALFSHAQRSLSQVLDEADKPGGRPAGFPLRTSATIAVTTAARRFTSPDVVGVIEGSDPSLKNEYVVLMAHADHIGMRKTGTGDRINNGALDNAAGVATLLEVARAFTTGRERPRRSILVVANTAEEKGLLGSEYFAHQPPVPIDRIVAAIDLDMPLLLYDFTDVVPYGATHSTIEAAFRAAGEQMGVAVSPDPMPEQSIFVRSDHYALAKVGVPAVMLATGMANGGQAAWNSFLTTNYHQPTDNLSLPIHWQAGARFAELNFRAIRVLANSVEPPKWYAGDYFGNLFAPNANKAPRP